MRKTSVQNFSHFSCVYVKLATCVCRSSTSRGAWVAFENKNKPVSVPMCTGGGPATIYIYFLGGGGGGGGREELESDYFSTI